MSLLDEITSKIPLPKKQEDLEYFFALNITPSKITAALWSVKGHSLNVQNSVSGEYSSETEIIDVADRLLDKCLGEMSLEPEKILFGVPDAWLQDDNLKEPNLKLLRNIVKSLELKPMAYVSTSHALAHMLEKKEGAPPTAIMVGIDGDITVSVIRAGKVDGSRVVKRSQNLGTDVEKALLDFTSVEVLPSKMFIYGVSETSLEKQREELLSFPWMNKLSFLHLPKIEILEENVAIKAIALAGAVEINPEVKYVPAVIAVATSSMSKPLPEEEVKTLDEVPAESEISDTLTDRDTDLPTHRPADLPNSDNLEPVNDDDLGFVTGDIAELEVKKHDQELDIPEEQTAVDPADYPTTPVGGGLSRRSDNLPSQTDDDYSTAVAPLSRLPAIFQRMPQLPGFGNKRLIAVPVLLLVLILTFLLLPQATVKVFVEPRVLERDTQVTVDPTITSVDEAGKRVPGEYVETEVSGSEKGVATGKKQIGDPSKGTVVLYNKTYSSKTFEKGTTLTSNNQKFTLDTSVTVASQSATDSGITFGKGTAGVTAEKIGADGNLSSGSEFTVAGAATSQYSAKAEGNFSGGTSKDVTVVTSDDQKKLLASLAANLRKQAQGQIQEKLNGKKILEDALEEEITKRSYSKAVNDQASEFTLNLSARYKGIAYQETDLKTIVAKLVETNVPEGFELNLAETETQADVAKVEKDKLIFVARFKAKLMPKLDAKQIRSQIRGKTPAEAAEILKGYENVLGSEIKISPPIPANIARLPFLDRNIKVEVSLK